MTKKVLPLFVLITLAACFLSYKFGSSPVALAKARPTAQETSESAVPLTLPTAPATWTVSAGSSGTQPATVTKAAGGAGVKHVVTCISFSESNFGGSGYDYNVALSDGVTGNIWRQTISVPAGTVVSSVCDLNIVGSPNAAMTLAFGGVASGFGEFVNLVGYDAQ